MSTQSTPAAMVQSTQQPRLKLRLKPLLRELREREILSGSNRPVPTYAQLRRAYGLKDTAFSRLNHAQTRSLDQVGAGAMIALLKDYGFQVTPNDILEFVSGTTDTGEDVTEVEN